MPALTYRRAAVDELPEVSAFVRRVYAHAIAPTESEEGRATYARFTDPETMRARAESCAVWVAESAGGVVGALEVRDGSHVAMLFVAPERQRSGVGSALLGAAFGAMEAWPALTVNSTPGAVGMYARLGFRATGPVEERDGLRFQPMARGGAAG